MKELFLNKSIGLIQQYHSPYTDDELDLLRYGLEGIYLTITKLVVITVLAVLLGIVKEVFLLLILFNIIRFTGFGVHAGDSKTCLITSTLFFIIIPYLLLHITIPEYIVYVICGICILSYLLYAPADTAKRPLNNRKKRAIRKSATIGIGILFAFAAIFLPSQSVKMMFLSALLVEMIMILPITYKLLGQPYHNWKNR